MKHYLRYENMVNEYKELSYCEALRCMWNNKQEQQKEFFTLYTLQ